MFLGVALPQESASVPSKIEVDTYMHCFNPFKAVAIFMCNQPNASVDDLLSALPKWKVTSKKDNGEETTSVVSDAEVESVLSKLEAEGTEFWYALDVESSEVWKEMLPVKSLQRDSLHEFAPSRFVCYLSISQDP